MKKIKLYALTGFLGAGKTTVLKTLLENLQQEKIGVIQNEFGKLSIDGEILRNDDIKMVEINKGSIFCSCLKLSFVEALAEMAKQDINYLFVESSGLADPSNMQEILKAVYALAGDAYDFEGAICLVDALHFNEQLEDTQTVSRQLKHCNLAIISKIDLIDTNKLDDVIKKIILPAALS
ncbi:MAG: GTP-binding protein, partial [Oscillospiraceae bacterium]